MKRREAWSVREPSVLIAPAATHEFKLHRGPQDAGSSSFLALQKSRVDEEVARIQAELFAIGSGAQGMTSICSGRDFDEAPDPADESAYDALEKAYNLAFSTASPTKLTRLEAEKSTQSCTNYSAEGSAHENDGTLWRRKMSVVRDTDVRGSREAYSKWKSMLKRSCLPFKAQPNELTSHENSDMRKDFHSISERARLLSSTRRTRQRVLQHLAEACRNRVLGRSKQRFFETKSSDRSRNLVVNPDQEEQSCPSQDDEFPRAEQSERKALMEYLVARLDAVAPSSSNAVMPEDAESIRMRCTYDRFVSASFAETKRYRETRAPLISSISGFGVSGVAEAETNPFQLPSDSGNSLWKSSLRTVDFSDCQSLLRHDRQRVDVHSTSLARELEKLYSQGFNAIILCQGHRAHEEARTFLLQLRLRREHLHLLVTTKERKESWRAAIVANSIRAFDKISLYTSGPGVTVVTVDEVDTTICNRWFSYGIFDVDCDSVLHGSGSDAWKTILMTKCRQRLLLSSSKASVDVRLLAMFVFPSLFTSSRALKAWNCGALSKRLVASAVSSVSKCVISCVEGTSDFDEWSLNVANATLHSVDREREVLDAFAVEPSKVGSADFTLKESDLETAKTREGSRDRMQPKVGHVIASSPAAFLTIDTKQLISGRSQALRSPKATVSTNRKRSNTSGSTARKARKRISRCGLCKGCLSEDCQKCGHCQDMKKYGGPGLRKQSCKRRKCTMPKARERKRAKHHAHGVTDELLRDRSGDTTTDFDGSDENSCGEADEADDSEFSMEKQIAMQAKRESNSTPYLSDTYDSDAQSDDMSESYRNVSDLATEDDEHQNGFISSDAKLRGLRSRVMRCGKCKGCTSGDCMKCIHCKDMKKYGGPGLRKQSCKNRKCVDPKVVLLNQLREKHEESLDGLESWGNDEGAAGETKKVLAPDTTALNHSVNRLQWLQVGQELDLVIRKFMFFKCDSCGVAFTSEKMLESHDDSCHDRCTARDKWDVEAETLLSSPVYQLPCLIASRRNLNPDWQPPAIRAYAKLEGHGFEFFFLKSSAVLGRLTSQWKRFYRARGFSDLKGLPGGQTECHLGDDSMIAPSHAMIKWDDALRQFTIECLSMLSSVSVNGKEVNFSSKPLHLRSRDLIQVGAAAFYFLLPSKAVGYETPKMAPKGEIEAWLAAATIKRQSSRDCEAIANKFISELER